MKNINITFVIFVISIISIDSCANKPKINKLNNEYFNMPLLKVIPNQLLSIFDSIVYFENITKSLHKCHDSSKICLIVVPNGNYGDTLSQEMAKNGEFTIWEDTHCSDSYFLAEECKYLYFGVVIDKDYLFFIHKNFRNTEWFLSTTANIKLKRTNLKKNNMPPAADNVSSWGIKYKNNSFYFPTSSIVR
jgi:hypothetical protein